ncbi:MAG: molybdopterin cofactor-binding domain-containing protein [Bryobacteraceae bacterium]
MDSTQWVGGTRNMVAHHLGVPQELARVVSSFVGGGFGSKGNPWPHPTLAAMAARKVGRPVKPGAWTAEDVYTSGTPARDVTAHANRGNFGRETSIDIARCRFRNVAL